MTGRKWINYAAMDRLLQLRQLGRKHKGNKITYEYIAEESNCSVRTVLNRSKTFDSSAKIITEEQLTDEKQTATDNKILEDYLPGKVLSPEESMRLMSHLATRVDLPEQVRIAADKRLSELRAVHQKRDAYRPDVPLNKRERIARGSAIIDCLGPEETAAAIKRLGWKIQDNKIIQPAAPLVEVTQATEEARKPT